MRAQCELQTSSLEAQMRTLNPKMPSHTGNQPDTRFHPPSLGGRAQPPPATHQHNLCHTLSAGPLSLSQGQTGDRKKDRRTSAFMLNPSEGNLIFRIDTLNGGINIGTI